MKYIYLILNDIISTRKFIICEIVPRKEKGHGTTQEPITIIKEENTIT